MHDDIISYHLTPLDKFKITPKLLGSKLYLKYINLLDNFSVRLLPTKTIAGLLILRIIDTFWRVCVALTFKLFNKMPLIPLFDYSFANCGYTREVHRDSDSRVIVVVLFLNTLDSESHGGELELYGVKATNNIIYSKSTYPAQPDPEHCNLLYSIKPRRGRLVMFYNQHNSYHAVSKND